MVLPIDIQGFLERLRPVAATFVDRQGESSKIIASGPCDPSTFTVSLGNPDINTSDTTLSGTCEGCTTSRIDILFLEFGGANTQGSTTGAVSFFYAVPTKRLFAATYSFSADESLVGRVRLETLTTLNGPFTSHEERNFFASIVIQRIVRVFDGEQTVLSLTEEIGSFASTGSSDNEFLGESQNINIDVTSLLFSQFAISGQNDLIIRFDYVFSAQAKGSDNRVIFSGVNGSGAFAVRNRAVTLQVNFASLFGPLRLIGE